MITNNFSLVGSSLGCEPLSYTPVLKNPTVRPTQQLREREDDWKEEEGGREMCIHRFQLRDNQIRQQLKEENDLEKESH